MQLSGPNRFGTSLLVYKWVDFGLSLCLVVGFESTVDVNFHFRMEE